MSELAWAEIKREQKLQASRLRKQPMKAMRVMKAAK